MDNTDPSRAEDLPDNTSSVNKQDAQGRMSWRFIRSRGFRRALVVIIIMYLGFMAWWIDKETRTSTLVVLNRASFTHDVCSVSVSPIEKWRIWDNKNAANSYDDPGRFTVRLRPGSYWVSVTSCGGLTNQIGVSPLVGEGSGPGYTYTSRIVEEPPRTFTVDTRMEPSKVNIILVTGYGSTIP